jgi:hypothetical protein
LGPTKPPPAPPVEDVAVVAPPVPLAVDDVDDIVVFFDEHEHEVPSAAKNGRERAATKRIRVRVNRSAIEQENASSRGSVKTLRRTRERVGSGA